MCPAAALGPEVWSLASGGRATRKSLDAQILATQSCWAYPKSCAAVSPQVTFAHCAEDTAGVGPPKRPDVGPLLPPDEDHRVLRSPRRQSKQGTRGGWGRGAPRGQRSCGREAERGGRSRGKRPQLSSWAQRAESGGAHSHLPEGSGARSAGPSLAVPRGHTERQRPQQEHFRHLTRKRTRDVPALFHRVLRSQRRTAVTRPCGSQSPFPYGAQAEGHGCRRTDTSRAVAPPGASALGSGQAGKGFPRTRSQPMAVGVVEPWVEAGRPGFQGQL